jgi:hypothetical protein
MDKQFAVMAKLLLRINSQLKGFNDSLQASNGIITTIE